MWLGHASFKLEAVVDGVTRVIYIDTWLQNPKLPDCQKDESGQPVTPTDADLVLVTHGHFDHAASAPEIVKASTKEGAKVVAAFELASYYMNAKGVPEANLHRMGKSGTYDAGWCKVTMVAADHSSSCGFNDCGEAIYAGGAAGFVIRLPNGVNVYHCGDTAVFGDMSIIDELYAPTHNLLCIGGNFTMGPVEAAYACAKFLKTAHTIVPMHFMTFPLIPGDVPEFKAELEKRGVTGKRVLDSYSEALGKWIDLEP